jgi:choline dehydrogenase-like flavoprotein
MEALVEYIRRTTESNYHPVGTCRMGADADPTAVLTPDLKVKGVEGLRVIDASMMPSIISANTDATVMAVADRSVDLMMRT